MIVSLSLVSPHCSGWAQSQARREQVDRREPDSCRTLCAVDGEDPRPTRKRGRIRSSRSALGCPPSGGRVPSVQDLIHVVDDRAERARDALELRRVDHASRPC
ncbi:hypothetical protein RZS08_49040, partial [Arthrospira platensis SPKY1]|nr:hypothetical protein [Arthrospira platensis SPKY1]